MRTDKRSTKTVISGDCTEATRNTEKRQLGFVKKIPHLHGGADPHEY